MMLGHIEQLTSRPQIEPFLIAVGHKENTMQPIDLVPGNLSAILSLVMQEQQKYIKAGMTPGFARVKAFGAVAPLIRPPTDDNALSKWCSRQAALKGVDTKTVNTNSSAAISNLKANGSVKWRMIDPEEVWKRKLSSSNHRSSILIPIMATMEPGMARAIECLDKLDARRMQTSVSGVAHRIGWWKAGNTGCRTKVTEIDGVWLINIWRPNQEQENADAAHRM